VSRPRPGAPRPKVSKPKPDIQRLRYPEIGPEQSSDQDWGLRMTSLWAGYNKI